MPPKTRHPEHDLVDEDGSTGSPELSRRTNAIQHPEISELEVGSRGGDFNFYSDELTPPGYKYASVFTPRQRIEYSTVFGTSSSKPTNKENQRERRFQEHKITMFAFRLAFIEKAASAIGTLAFIWATVVVLGGFASSISFDNFWVVAVIIVAEASRIFNRSRELEWQIFSTKFTPSPRKATPSTSVRFQNDPHNHSTVVPTSSSSESTINGSPDSSVPPTPKTTAKRFPRGRQSGIDFRKLKSISTWSRREVHLLSFADNQRTSLVVSVFLYALQVTSAVVCVALSIWRLSDRNFCRDADGLSPCDDQYQNVRVSMILFYGLAILEATFFLWGKAYFEYMMRRQKLLDEVREELRLKPGFSDVFKTYFYNIYSQCLKGSVFDGLDMDLVAFGIQWLQSEHPDQQLHGAQLLEHFIRKPVRVKSKSYSSNNDQPEDKHEKHHIALREDALRRLGTSPGVVERLVEMLSWNTQQEEKLVGTTAEIIRRLVAYDRNCSRIVDVPGSLDAIVSLLKLRAPPNNSLDVEIQLKGLHILRLLCKTHKNIKVIGETKGLLSYLFIFIEVHRDERRDALRICKASLKLLLSLAAATNNSGTTVRRGIAAIVSGLRNLRDVIEQYGKQAKLQLLSVDILYHLALDKEVRDSIGATGGVLRLLFELFQRPDDTTAEKAGKVLSRLTVQNKNNCLRLLKINGLMDEMEKALGRTESIAASAAELLRSCHSYAERGIKKQITKLSAPTVLKNIFEVRPRSEETRSPIYQASLGLASRALESFPLLDKKETLSEESRVQFMRQLIRNLRRPPHIDAPKIRRYTVEFITSLIRRDTQFLKDCARHKLDLRRALGDALDSISEVENYILFSGLIGLTKHEKSMESLVLLCLGAVEKFESRSGPKYKNQMQKQQKQTQDGAGEASPSSPLEGYYSD